MKNLKNFFSDAVVYKAPDKCKFFQDLSIPSFLRDCLIRKFSDKDTGEIDKEGVLDYIRNYIPRREHWEKLKFKLISSNNEITFLARVKAETDIPSGLVYFSLPDFSSHKGEGIIEKYVVEKNKNYLLSSDEIWGHITIFYDSSSDVNIVKMINFEPFRPYSVDIDEFCEARENFSTEEWIDVILMAIDYNPAGFSDISQKLTIIYRLLPFAEKKINLIELAPKGTGKSYMFSQLSKYGWLVSGGSISRAKMFYDIQKRSSGIVSHYDYIALDEIQTIQFKDKNEMQGALKGYLESGEFRVADYKGAASAGFVLLGNISTEYMNENQNMFIELPDFFRRESALIDRFHGFIKGWDIPRMKENLKAEGWALNTEFYTEILHLIRDEMTYRYIADEILDIPANADTRDTEAVKRICAGLHKLIFPNVRNISQINISDYEKYCLRPAMNMRGIIKKQLGFLDMQFSGKYMPDIKLKYI